MLENRLLGYYGGMQIFELPFIKECRQTRRHRKRRINKKWLKRYGVTIIPYPSDTVYLAGDIIICHAKVAATLRDMEKRKGGGSG